MPSRKAKDEALPESFNFRSPPDLSKRLLRVAKALGLDVSNLIRMVLYESLAAYEARADEAEAKQRRER